MSLSSCCLIFDKSAVVSDEEDSLTAASWITATSPLFRSMDVKAGSLPSGLAISNAALMIARSAYA